MVFGVRVPGIRGLWEFWEFPGAILLRGFQEHIKGT